MYFSKDSIGFDPVVYTYATVPNCPHEKENAFSNALRMVGRSWTFGRMTQEEKENCVKAFLWAEEQGLIVGDYARRWKTMQAIYNAFLTALGYYDNPVNWRG